MAGYSLGVLLLAAGQSRRFAGIKQLALLQHKTMLQSALDLIAEVECDYRVVALGANQTDIETAIKVPSNVSIKTVSDWQIGISASIKAGLETLHNCSHMLIMLADQPDISLQQIEQLIAYSRSNREAIICGNYLERNAVPAIFPADDYALLRNLQGDKGAGKYLNSPEYQDKVIAVALQSGAMDIDTQEDLSHWQKQQKVNL